MFIYAKSVHKPREPRVSPKTGVLATTGYSRFPHFREKEQRSMREAPLLNCSIRGVRKSNIFFFQYGSFDSCEGKKRKKGEIWRCFDARFLFCLPDRSVTRWYRIAKRKSENHRKIRIHHVVLPWSRDDSHDQRSSPTVYRGLRIIRANKRSNLSAYSTARTNAQSLKHDPRAPRFRHWEMRAL